MTSRAGTPAPMAQAAGEGPPRQAHRVVRGLQWARPAAPETKVRGKARGSNPAGTLGLRYERRLAKAAGAASNASRIWVAEKWFEFYDTNGYGQCQPDLVRTIAGQLLVLEAKLSWLPSAHTQIDQLYRPVLEMALGQAVIGVVVCKALAPGCPPEWVTYDLESAWKRARKGYPTVLLWLSGNPSLLALPL